MRFVEHHHCVVKPKSERERGNLRARPAQSAKMKSDPRRLTVSGGPPSASGHQQRSDNVRAWSGQPHKADLSKNSPSMPLSATSEALARFTSIGSHCGRTLWAIPLRAHGILQAGRSRPRYESGATGGKLEIGSRPKAISEIARLRRSLPEPDPENRAAISIRSARPPIITVIGASPHRCRIDGLSPAS